MVDYLNGESSLVSFQGRLLMMDSISWCYPWHIRFDDPEKATSCVSYIRIRDMLSNTIISNMTASCQHSFGAAFEHDGTLYVYATRCARYMQPHSWCEKPAILQPCDCWHGGGGNVTRCAVDVYWSKDLKNWETQPAYFPGTMMPNVDVVAVTGREDMTFLVRFT
jgi:hypothetical protein